MFTLPLQPQTKQGAIAQLVEQRTENPCVPGSIPGGTTLKERELQKCDSLFLFSNRAKDWLKQTNVFSNVLTKRTIVDIICIPNLFRWQLIMGFHKRGLRFRIE